MRFACFASVLQDANRACSLISEAKTYPLIAYAEFASPAVAAAALEQCRGKKIGDSSCKFDVCQKLPNFHDKKPQRRERRPPRAAAPAEASAASESKREA